MCPDFMDVGYVRSNDCLKIDPCKKDKHQSLDNIYLCILATDTMAAIKQELGDRDPSIALVYSQSNPDLVIATY
jgi:hypothetical protein